MRVWGAIGAPRLHLGGCGWRGVVGIATVVLVCGYLLGPGVCRAGESVLPVADLLAATRDGDELESYVTFTLRFRADTIVKASFGATRKGNGSIQIGRTHVRIYDYHADGITFAGGLLDAGFWDFDGDGIPELILAGTVETRDERTWEVIATRPLYTIWRLRKDASGLDAILPDPALYTWDEPIRP